STNFFQVLLKLNRCVELFFMKFFTICLRRGEKTCVLFGIKNGRFKNLFTD
ncbi:hypothetical protein HMPREF9554_01507, partial [Treponema phagedenis F0421]